MAYRSLLVAAAAVVWATAAVPDKPLTKAFVNLDGWTGGDAAYSVPLSSRRSLWVFGDTFIGTISKGARKNAEMVHNTAAWMDLQAGKAPRMKFFWKQEGGKPVALVKPEGTGKAYYWPSGMTVVPGGKLALFCKVIVDKPVGKDGDPAFGFDWVGQDLALIENASDDPAAWKYKTMHLPGGEAAIYPGSACMVDGDYVYVYGTLNGTGSHPAVLMRIPANDLSQADVSKFEYWAAKSEWSKYPVDPITLFDHGAPEMSVSTVKGLPGYWCVYTENGLGPNIMLRHAERPEGPWSTPECVYQVPEASSPNVLCYGAKHHPELAPDDRTLVITYCLNPGPLKEHVMQPMTYFPKAITVRVRPVQP